jgi:hypothetical protein
MRRGFREEQIGVAGRDGFQTGAPRKSRSSRSGQKVADGAVTGVAAGAGVGALWALGIAAGVVPVIGPVIAGGLLASVLASAAGGAAVAGLVGALVGAGVPEEEARYYEGQLKAGRTLVTVKAGGRVGEVRALFRRFGGCDLRSGDKTTAAVSPPEGAATPTAAGTSGRAKVGATSNARVRDKGTGPVRK